MDRHLDVYSQPSVARVDLSGDRIHQTYLASASAVLTCQTCVIYQTTLR